MMCNVVVSPEKGKVELQEMMVSEPAEDEVQVRVHVSLISPGTERAFILGLPNTAETYPLEPGYCAAGVVEKAGSRVTRFKAGDRVAAYGIGHRSFGNLAQQWVLPVPDGIFFEHAVFLSLGQTSLQGIRKARIEIGEMAVVIGLGLIGQIALQLASLNGALPVIGVDRVKKRLEIAMVCGADEIIDAPDDTWPDRLKDRPAVVVEATGAPEAIGAALQAIDSFGRVCLLGSTRGDRTINFYRDVHKKGVTLVGAHTTGANPGTESRPGFWTFQDDADCFLRLLKKGRVKLDPLITDRVCRQDAEMAYKRLLSWDLDMVGTVIRWV